jgi:hypothetical protein
LGLSREAVAEDLSWLSSSSLGVDLVVEATSTREDAERVAGRLFAQMSGASGNAAMLSREYFDRVLPESEGLNGLDAEMPPTHVVIAIGPNAWTQALQATTIPVVPVVLDPSPDADHVAQADEAIRNGFEAAALADQRRDPEIAAQLKVFEAPPPLRAIREEQRTAILSYQEAIEGA